MQPVFLISLPRSGSTLLQRLAMKHPEIESKSEPWIMLPLVYMLKEGGSVTEYDHWLSYCAFQDFIKELPNREQDFQQQLRNFTTGLYQSQCRNNEEYFLDKTPRYYLILDELASIFPDAKFIFLVRNPLQIMASLVSTFSNNTLRNLHFYHIDIYRGFKQISRGIEKYKDRGLVIRYEDIISDHESVLSRLFSFLELNPFAVDNDLEVNQLNGRLGDKNGSVVYKKIEGEALDKWKEVFSEAARKTYLRKIIHSIDEEIFEGYGYPKKELMDDIASIKTRYTLNSLRDWNDIITSRMIKRFYLNLYRPKIQSWSKDITLS